MRGGGVPGAEAGAGEGCGLGLGWSGALKVRMLPSGARCHCINESLGIPFLLARCLELATDESLSVST